MTAHVDHFLPEYALGTLPTAERGAVEGHLVACGRCVAELAATNDALHAAALAKAPLLAAPENVPARLMDPVRGRGRLAPFRERIARLFDLATEKIEEIFASLEDPKSWVPGPGGGNELAFVPKGPRLLGAEAGFVRLDPGLHF